ncbi:MAG: HAD family hydrolase [Alphaproteobacteria bacterium]|nr:HAD family hydrolase [Alphaproteobacteria bacterium]
MRGEPPIRIAMWSGPRNISTAMMRSFENRADCAVTDEPFYAAYLARTGVDHPLREAVLDSQPTDPVAVARTLIGAAPGGAALWYQKHMAQHILPGDPLDWTADLRNAFLIRDPRAVVASFAKARGRPAPFELGFERQAEIFDHVRAATGETPPVMDAADILGAPARALPALCRALAIPFDPAMLAWPAGRRESDGVWAPVWYKAVEASTGFAAPSPPPATLPPALAEIAESCRPAYDRLAAHRLSV